ncbi:MAG TPA: cytochrome c [Acetobacteraceae bacterium]|nr:cytochrome c [Acetobacteraceae bacterium]
MGPFVIAAGAMGPRIKSGGDGARGVGVVLGAALAGLVIAGPAGAAPRSYALPDETAALAPGPNVEVAQQNCTACHSADYISTQPRKLPNARAFWQAEVVKMKSAYGAPIQQEDVPKIVDYLAETYP